LTKVSNAGIYGKFASPYDIGLIAKGKNIFEPKYFTLKFTEIGKIATFHKIGRLEPRAYFCSWRVDILKKNGNIINLYLDDLEGFKGALRKAGISFQGVKVEKIVWKNE
jgi:hypothetical protein